MRYVPWTAVFFVVVVGCSSEDPGRPLAGARGGGAGDLAVDNPSGPSSLPMSSGPRDVVPIMPGSAPTAGPTMSSPGTVPPTPPHEPIFIDQTGADNPAGLAADDVKQLIDGGSPGSLRVLYPYAGTVFPRGLLAPLLMWDGAVGDAVYVHIKAQSFEYKGVLPVTLDAALMTPQLTLPQDVWVQAGSHTNGKNDPFTLELTVRDGGTISGPISLQFYVAQATVKGSIYYNSYASKLPGAAIGGNILRIPAGGSVELFNSMQCNGCHSVSADGSKMLSQIELNGGGNAYTLVSGGPANPPGAPAGARVSFGALYPDGTHYLSTSTSVNVGHAEIAQAPGTAPEAALYDTTTGAIVPDTGVPAGAMMPMFSPDGTRLVFNDVAINNADGLAVMDYDTLNHKGANYRILMTDEDTMTRPGWPFFLPDSKGVVFLRTVSPDFSANGAFIGAGAFAAFAGPFADLASAPVTGPQSDLYLADVDTGTVSLLAKAMGFETPEAAASGTTYLPFPDDVRQSYFPTVAPIAAGGYFWVFFDSIRHYGNLGTQRQLWGFAIDIQPNGSYTADLSHPAFYLPGQEFGAGNHRAFAALDPCKKDGDSCTSGIDCCGGTCYITEVAELVDPVGSCMPPPVDSCAKRDERCTTDADCCLPQGNDPPNTCIAGFCAFVPLN